MSTPVLPDRARVVVIGGGVIGTSGGLSPGAPGLEGRGAAGARPAHVRHDLACRRPDGDVRVHVRDLHRDAQVHARSLQPARSGDGAGDRLQARGFHRGGCRRRPAGGIPPGRGVQSLLRRRRARDFAVGGEAPVPAGACGRHPGRLLRQGRRPGESGGRHHGAGQGRAHGGRPHHRGRAGDAGAAAKGPRHRRSHRRSATSQPRSSSTARACGRASSASRPASPSPIRRPSTTT